MRYDVRTEHGESWSIFQVMSVDGDTKSLVMGWDTESHPNAGWLAQDCCDLHNAKQWGKFTPGMLPILGVMWHEFDSLTEGEAFVEWAEYITKNDYRPCKAFLMGGGENGRWEVMVRNW